jgi:hypothetical protein
MDDFGGFSALSQPQPSFEVLSIEHQWLKMTKEAEQWFAVDPETPLSMAIVFPIEVEAPQGGVT